MFIHNVIRSGTVYVFLKPAYSEPLSIFIQCEQVRDSMREKFSDSLRERDTEAIQQLLDKCNQGPQQPNQDNEFYPLPHNAYTQPDQHPPP